MQGKGRAPEWTSSWARKPDSLAVEKGHWVQANRVRLCLRPGVGAEVAVNGGGVVAAGGGAAEGLFARVGTGVGLEVAGAGRRVGAKGVGARVVGQHNVEVLGKSPPARRWRRQKAAAQYAAAAAGGGAAHSEPLKSAPSPCRAAELTAGTRGR